MKKYVTISLFIFWAVIVAVTTASLIVYNKNSKPVLNPIQNNLILTTTELVKHNSRQSCWLLISGKIYDITSYFNQHPGGVSTILPTCGTDATQAYDTKGRPNGRPHSSNANAMLADYFIGNLN